MEENKGDDKVDVKIEEKKEVKIEDKVEAKVEVKIEEKESTYCKQLTLYLRQGRYLLSTPNAVYSFDDL